MRETGYYLAVDGGGTKTACWLGDKTRVLAKASCGTVKLMNVGEAVATERLRGIVGEVLEAEGLCADDIERSVVGLGGISIERVKRWAAETMQRCAGGELVVVGDEEIALDAAFGDGPGILVVAGTGSIVVGRCADGRMTNAGGWGPVIGDEGSGYWIGLEAIRAGLLARDRGVASCLLEEIQKQWKLENLGDLIAYANAAERPAFGELTRVVVECADRGDVLAAGVLERAGEELAEAVSLVASKMAALGCSATGVAYAGSVLGKIVRVRKAFGEHLHAALPTMVLREEAVEPLEGALWKARRG